MPSCCGSWGWRNDGRRAGRPRALTIEAIVARWGVAAVFAGAMLEGETAVIAGGLFAHHGLVRWPAVMAAAALGSFIADQAFFAAGRRYRDRAWVQRWTRQRTFAKALELLERWPVGFIFAFRFLYGFRTVSPLAIGASRVPTATFVPLNAAAAVVWAAVYTALGYWFGEAVTELAGRLQPSRHTLIVGAGTLVAGFALFKLLMWWRNR